MVKTNRVEIDEDYQGSTARVADWVKKTILTGMGAVFLTEEGIRNALSEVKLPKNVVLSAVNQAEKTRQDIIKLVAKEVRRFLDNIEVDEIIKKSLSGQSIEITAKIRFPKVHDARKNKKKDEKGNK